MIDELFKVASAMKDAGIASVNWHPKLKTLPSVSKQAPCIRVWLTSDGHIKDVELLEKEQVEQLRKYEPDNGKSLPGFNVRPLYRIVKSDDEIKDAARGKEGEKLKMGWAKEFLARDPEEQTKEDYWGKTRDTLGQCFGRVRKELEQACADNLKKGETLRVFLDAVSQINVGQYQKEYSNAVQHKIQEGEFPLALMFYFVTETKKRGEDDNSRVQVPRFPVFLDVKDYKDYPVAHSVTISRLNALLMNTKGKKSVSDDDPNEKDAYGLDAHQKEDKFPGVTLPYLGGVILRSQAKTIPAQKRYHQCESDTFPAGTKTRQRVKAALEWVANRERNGQTYGVAAEGELLFAYPRVLPKSKIPLAKMIGAHTDANLREVRFEQLAKSVIEQLKGAGESPEKAELEIFSLRKMDKARTKVVYYRNTTVALLEACSLDWHEGCQNIPPLALRDWSKAKGGEITAPHPVPVDRATVYPLKLYRFLNTAWTRDRKKMRSYDKVKMFKPADGLRLLLEKPCDSLALHMMERLMQHAQGYFLTLCQSAGRNEVVKLSDKEYYPGILGLLLFKSNKRKDEYMNESAFLLGRFLRVADELHRLYCEEVRNKDLPPELCGSSLLVGMMESPGMALSQLAMRSAPYVKWGRGGSNKGDKGGLVWYWLRQWEDISEQLRALQWPKRMTPDERAQVFIGFLSSFSKKDNHGGAETKNAIEEGELK